MNVYEVNMRMCGNLRITEEDFKEGIILKFTDEMPRVEDRHDRHVRIYLKKPKTEGKKTKLVPVIPTIPGHPNCQYGDCDRECHVVSCGIYQGYEDTPRLPPDYKYDYVEVEVDEDED